MRTLSVLVVLFALAACDSSDDGQRSPRSDTSGGDSAVTPDGFVAPDATDDAAAPDVGSTDGTDTPADVSVLPDTAPADVAPGTLSCKEFYQQCVSQCPKGADGQATPECFDACKPQLSVEGLAVTDALVACVDQAGCSGIADAGQALSCFANACSSQYFACFHGDQACKDVLTCMGGCAQGDGYDACVVACSQDGTEDAQQQLIAILQCIGQACCPDDAAACNTDAGKQCGKDAVGFGGACFTQASQCALGL